MSNFFTLIDELELNKNALTNKKQQTDYKIKYVSEYIKQWAIIGSMREEITDITFIDCMCNAGIYSDGDLCTSTEVLLIFTEVAQKHPDKKYNLYLNDYDANKLKVLNTVIVDFACLCYDNVATLFYLNEIMYTLQKIAYMLKGMRPNINPNLF